MDQYSGGQNGPPGGLPNGHLLAGPSPRQVPPRNRPFTLQEVLPYSPQTSVIPFTADLIPHPSPGSGPIAPSITNLFPSTDFENFNKEATGQSQLPKSVKSAADYILHDLKANPRTPYKFSPISTPLAGLSVPTSSLLNTLSPLSRAVFEKAQTYFSHLNTVTPSASPAVATRAEPPKKKAESPQSHRSAKAATPTGRATSNAKAHKQNAARIEVAIPIKMVRETEIIAPSPMSTPVSQQQTIHGKTLVSALDTYPDAGARGSTNAPAPATTVPPEVAMQLAPQELPPTVTPITPGPLTVGASSTSEPNLPVTPTRPSQSTPVAKPIFTIDLQTPSHFNKDEYLEVPDSPDVPQSLSIRRTKQVDGSQDAITNRQRAEGTLNELDRLMQDAFSAVSQVLAGNDGYGHVAALNKDREPCLTTSTQQKLQALILKVIDLGCYGEVPIEDLLRTQKLCEANMRQIDTTDIKMDESLSESEVQTWLEVLPDLETGLKAARTSVRVMCGGREDKQLYSEDTIKQCMDLCRTVMDSVIVPLATLRSTGPSSNVFKLLSSHKKAVANIFTNAQRLFSVLATLVSRIELSDEVLHTLEFVATNLIFVENAHTEKDSVVGVQKFDGIRLVAMDMLCQIFITSQQQRRGIFESILTSLAKLPVGKQSARHFKLADGAGSIQPVSALIMRLIQSSSGRPNDKQALKQPTALESIEGDEDEADDTDALANGGGRAMATVTNDDDAAVDHGAAIEDLENVSKRLGESVRRNAAYVTNFIVKRAMKSTKSGDEPYRNLLELFVEDFTTCLDLVDWPAAELMLRSLMVVMFSLINDEKTSAPSKNMALEHLGTMCAAISKLRSHVRRAATSIEGLDSDELSRFVAELASSALEMRSRPEHIVDWQGPYRATLESLYERAAGDTHLNGAIAYTILEWAEKTRGAYDRASAEEITERDRDLGQLAFRLRMMIEDRGWLPREYQFKTVAASMAKLCYNVVLLRSPFCEQFGNILNILLRAMDSDQATVRSKALKSINQVLEIDPSILDGESTVVPIILQCSSDSSTQVRDSALGLIGKCIALRPALEVKMIRQIIDRFQDTGVGVRKRAMKLARDVYLRNDDKPIRSAIANGLLLRVQDPDEGVRDVARQVIEDIWFAPFYNMDDSAAFQKSLTDHVALMIHTTKNGAVAQVMDKIMQSFLAPKTKPTDEGQIFAVCKRLVANMFELIDNLDSDDASLPAGRDALQVLMVFAKAEPKLFTFEQIRLLKPHLSSFGQPEDIAVFRAVVVIYRRILPQLSSKVHAQFLGEIRSLLHNAIGKVSRALHDDVIACAWIISKLLGQPISLAKLAGSSLSAIAKIAESGPLDAKKMAMFGRYSVIVGMVGKHCELDDLADVFRQYFPKWKGNSVPKLMIDCLLPFAARKVPLDSKKPALDAIGLVCQSHPRNYVDEKVYTVFQQVFEDGPPILESTILRSFKEFLLTEERRSEAASASAAGNGLKPEKRELTVMGGTNYDDVASATTQRFLDNIIQISTQSQDEHAFLAVEVLSSINRQGLVHPKQTGVALLTLMTSSVRGISELAFQEYRVLHEKHETVIEREYAKSIQSTFQYQRDVARDPHGATTEPYQAKLHLLMEVLKISKSKNRLKFLEKFVGQLAFEPNQLDVSKGVPEHVGFARFLVENIAFFDYMTVGELHATVHAMEKLVTSTGSTVAQVIEAEVYNVRMDVEPTPDMQLLGQPAAPSPMDPIRFRQLSMSAIILLCVWDARTYLRRLYNMGTSRKDTKAKGAFKDLNKTPIKLPGVNGDKFWEDVASNMAGLDSQEGMEQRCKAFVELMNIDKELKVEDDADEANGEARTPSDGEGEEEDIPGSGRGRKRKASTTPGGRKKRQRSSSAQPRGRARPRKQSMDADADGEYDEDWF